MQPNNESPLGLQCLKLAKADFRPSTQFCAARLEQQLESDLHNARIASAGDVSERTGSWIRGVIGSRKIGIRIDPTVGIAELRMVEQRVRTIVRIHFSREIRIKSGADEFPNTVVDYTTETK